MSSFLFPFSSLGETGLQRQYIHGVTVVISSPNPNQLLGGKSAFEVPFSRLEMSTPLAITFDDPTVAADLSGRLLGPKLELLWSQRLPPALKAGTKSAGLMIMVKCD